MTDERSNAEIVEQSLAEWMDGRELAEAAVDALAAAGRLVTPERDAQVIRRTAYGLYLSNQFPGGVARLTDGVRALLLGRADTIEKGDPS